MGAAHPTTTRTPSAARPADWLARHLTDEHTRYLSTTFALGMTGQPILAWAWPGGLTPGVVAHGVGARPTFER
jgi:hypothetical protein